MIGDNIFNIRLIISEILTWGDDSTRDI